MNKITNLKELSDKELAELAYIKILGSESKIEPDISWKFIGIIIEEMHKRNRWKHITPRRLLETALLLDTLEKSIGIYK